MNQGEGGAAALELTSTEEKVDLKPSGGNTDTSDTARRMNEYWRERHSESDVTYSWVLEDAEKIEVTFFGNTSKKPTQRDLEVVIDHLELLKN